MKKSSLLYLVVTVFAGLIISACNEKSQVDFPQPTTKIVKAESGDPQSLIDPWTETVSLHLMPAWMISMQDDTRDSYSNGGFTLNPGSLTLQLKSADNAAKYQAPVPEIDIPGLIESLISEQGLLPDNYSFFPALAENHLILPGRTGELLLYDLKSGQSKILTLAGGGFNAVAWMPTMPDSIFLSSSSGELASFSISSGELQWSRSYSRAVRILNFTPRPRSEAESRTSDSTAQSAGQSAEQSSDQSTDRSGENTAVNSSPDGTGTDSPGDISPEPFLLNLVSENGWFAVIDPATGREQYRSLEYQSYTAGTGDGQSRFFRAGAAHLELLDLKAGGTAPGNTEGSSLDLSMESADRLSLPWPNPGFLRHSGGHLIISSSTLPPDSSGNTTDKGDNLLYALDPETMVISWAYDFSELKPLEADSLQSVSSGKDIAADSTADSGEGTGSTGGSSESGSVAGAEEDDEGTAASAPAPAVIRRITEIGPDRLLVSVGGRLLLIDAVSGDIREIDSRTADGPPVELRSKQIMLLDDHALVFDADGVSPREYIPAGIKTLVVLPANSLGYDTALYIPDAGTRNLNADPQPRGDYAYQFDHRDLPVSLKLDPGSTDDGLFSIESSDAIELLILDADGTEIMSSENKVSLDSELSYRLPAGTYYLKVTDAGGDDPDGRVIIRHRQY